MVIMGIGYRYISLALLVVGSSLLLAQERVLRVPDGRVLTNSPDPQLSFNAREIGNIIARPNQLPGDLLGIRKSILDQNSFFVYTVEDVFNKVQTRAYVSNRLSSSRKRITKEYLRADTLLESKLLDFIDSALSGLTIGEKARMELEKNLEDAKKQIGALTAIIEEELRERLLSDQTFIDELKAKMEE